MTVLCPSKISFSMHPVSENWGDNWGESPPEIWTWNVLNLPARAVAITKWISEIGP